MARKTKKTEALVANMAEELDMQDLERAIAEAEILEAEPVTEEAPAEDMAQALAQVNAYDPDQAADEAVEEAPVEAPADESASFGELFDAVTDEEGAERTKELLAAFEERARYEAETNPNNDNIQKTISKLVKGVTPGISKALVVTGTLAGYVNDSEVTGKRRNVYALEKLRDILYGAVVGMPTNAINRAIITTMVRCHNAGLPFTGEVAKAAASDKCFAPPAYQGLMMSHTVSASTAPTQMSSTMTALEVLGAVVNTGTRQHPVFVLTQTPLARRLIEMVNGKEVAA